MVQKHSINITQTDQGFHERHWYNTLGIDPESVVEIKKQLTIPSAKSSKENNILVMDDSLGRIIIKNNRAISAFPWWKGIVYEQVRMLSISEWSHSDCLEAVIHVGHPSGCAIFFFALDYAFNKMEYRQKDIEVNIVGLAYIIREYEPEDAIVNGKVEKASDFHGYSLMEDRDDIHFVAKIQHFTKHNLGSLAGYIVNVKLTSSFYLDFFIAEERLTIELVVNKHIDGVLWIIGTLER